VTSRWAHELLVSPAPPADRLTHATWKPPFCSSFFKPSDGLEPSTPSLPCAAIGNRSQRTATVFACLSLFRRRAVCDRLPPVATTGLHKGSILGRLFGQRRRLILRLAAALAGAPGASRIPSRLLGESHVAVQTSSPDARPPVRSWQARLPASLRSPTDPHAEGGHRAVTALARLVSLPQSEHGRVWLQRLRRR